MTSEDGKTVRLTVSLLEQPRRTITVEATTSDVSEGSVSGPLQFDAENWQTPQEIIVKGEDDEDDDGDVIYDVTIKARSSTLGYAHVSVVEVFSFVNLDDETARFRGLGDLPGGEVTSHASAVSAAGDVIVGWSGAALGDEAFRWTLDSGIVGLGGNQSRANNVSPNGQMIVGSVAEASYEGGRAAAIWRGDSPIAVEPPYPPPPTPILFYPVDATVALDSGEWFGACIQRGAYGVRLICHVSVEHELDTRGGGDVFAGNAAGYVVGTRYSDPRTSVAGRPGYQSGLLSFPLTFPAGGECFVPHSCAAQARAFSSDPVVITGTSQVPPVGQSTLGGAALINVAFVATEGEGMVRLDDLAGGDNDSGAYAIDASGRVIGGFGTNADGTRATVWVDRSPRLLTDVIASAGGDVPDGWILSEVRAISQDGRTFVGNGQNPAGEPEGFIVTLLSALTP